ncbi:MAG: hypothetical protein IKT08_08490 [Bacteroidales bacterium]|nr:hypothetical protein [Bacteroidales bacterium]
MEDNELNLRAFDALLWQYHGLYVKQFAYGGINEDEFEEIKRLFVEGCRMAEDLLKDFEKKCDCLETDDFDIVLERAEHWGVLHYSCWWKKMYHERLPHVEENRMTSEDRDRVFSAYDLLKIANYKLAAWILIEKENGVTGKDNPELLHKLYHYFSELSPYRNYYPGCSFTTQAEIWYQAENHDYGDIHPDDLDANVWDYFKKRMEEYMAVHGLPHPLVIPSEIEDKIVCSRGYQRIFSDDVESCILSAMKDNRSIEIVYFSFDDGTSHLSTYGVTPIRMVYKDYYWTLIGVNESGQTKEFVVRRILNIKNKR